MDINSTLTQTLINVLAVCGIGAAKLSRKWYRAGDLIGRGLMDTRIGNLEIRKLQT